MPPDLCPLISVRYDGTSRRWGGEFINCLITCMSHIIIKGFIHLVIIEMSNNNPDKRAHLI